MERKYKDSGIEWIGKIPETWEVTRMKFLGAFLNGFAFKPEDWASEGLPIIRIQDLSGTNDSPNYYKGVIDHKYLVHKGDILISWAATLDAFVWEKEDGWLNQHIFKAEIYPNINKRFFYWLAKMAMLNMNNDNKHGIFMQHVTSGTFNNFRVPLPPLDEQLLIGDYLDKKCGEIDSLIALQEQMIEKLKAYKQSVITEAVTKGLDPNTKLVPSGIDWIGEIPEKWKVTPLKWILRMPLQYGANESGILFDDSLPRYVRITDILNNNLREDLQKQSLTEEQANGYLLEDNDILFARSGGTVGKAFIYKSKYGRCAFAGYLIRAQINKQNDSKFIYYYTQSSSYDEWKKQIFIQATIQNIGADRYSILEIPIPPLSEQQAIASYLDFKCSDIDHLIALKQQKIESLKEYKKSVIYEAVTGKTIV